LPGGESDHSPACFFTTRLSGVLPRVSSARGPSGGCDTNPTLPHRRDRPFFDRQKANIAPTSIIWGVTGAAAWLGIFWGTWCLLPS
jgi:hypothetical protein